MEQTADAGYRPTIMVTNDDGIDAPGLQALVRVLISTDRYKVQVCAPDSEKSAFSHSITWRTAVSVQQVNINGATAFAVSGTPADCASLGVSGSLFPTTPDLVALLLLLLYENVNDFITLGLYPRVISGINMGSNCGYHISISRSTAIMKWVSLFILAAAMIGSHWNCSVYSGTVAGAREAFFNGIPALSLSYNWVGGTSNVDDYTLAAEACLPIVNAMLAEIKNKTYPQKCFLNVDLPTNVASHKVEIELRCGRNVSGIQVDQAGEKYCQNGVEASYFCCTRRKNVVNNDNGDKFTDELRNGCLDYAKRTSFIHERKVRNFFADLGENPTWEYTIFPVRGVVVDEDDTDYRSLQEGYITVTPLGALSHADKECQAYFKDWLPGVAECFSSSTL
ncbi:hypothetical protein RHSIM_Rhsim04G0202900 [Rhododendron simsii]|uniref:Survival protein SurE-like phosphatase/nucleotidase domain-containing protein n=1 Tax=Rhododendron simsii TaxID=118357 RepID=A0A834H0T1_RHOSS|nr:hypothetical protein RHSIM_Rhsim04G0202900 [Rhododendron simsii]